MRGLGLGCLGLLLVGCGAPESDGQPRQEAWGGLELPSGACRPNHDGQLGPGELLVDLDADVRAAFLVNPPGSVRTVVPGGVAEDDGLVWDLSGAAEPEDRVLFLGPDAVGGAWFADAFADAEYSALLDAATGTLGLHRLDDEGLWLLGVASQDPSTTALRYTPPVLLLPTPLAPGDDWQVEAAAEGLADGLTYPRDLGDDGVVTLLHRWSFEVTGQGRVRTPGADLAALRVDASLRIEARNSVAGLFATDHQRVRLWVAECLGVVARVRSRVDEIDPDFTVATEVLRFGFEPELLP